MQIQHIGLNEINGSLIALEGVDNAAYEEIVNIDIGDGEKRTGRIVQIEGDKVVVQVFEGTRGLPVLILLQLLPAILWKFLLLRKY